MSSLVAAGGRALIGFRHFCSMVLKRTRVGETHSDGRAGRQERCLLTGAQAEACHHLQYHGGPSGGRERKGKAWARAFSVAFAGVNG